MMRSTFILPLFCLFLLACPKEVAPKNSSDFIWKDVLQSQILDHFQEFAKASDWTGLCPTWDKLAQSSKLDVISELAVQICTFESECDPKAYSPDDVDGTASIGLFQLSYEDKFPWCEMTDLKDPIVNIKCAVPEMARLIAQDGVVAAGQQKGTRRGLARYWSVMWPGTKQGHLNQIKDHLHNFAACRE